MGLLSKLDPWLYRYPFEGPSARRYALRERCGFDDLDQRLLADWADELERAGTFLDVGCGPATLATRVATRYPNMRVIGVEPSRDYVASAPPSITMIRSCAEALPVAPNSVDFAVCLSSIRHVGDRARALSELRRVVRPGGVLYVVELDPLASRERARAHARRLRSAWARLVFGPLVLRTAPEAGLFAELGRAAGFGDIALRSDPFQPVYILRLAG